MKTRAIFETKEAFEESIRQDRRDGAPPPPLELSNTLNIREDSFQGRLVYVLTPKNARSNSPVIFYLHGGAFVHDIRRQHWEFLERLAVDSGAPLVVPIYPLAPESHCREILAFALDLYRDRIGTRPCVLMGDSAGGGLALAMAQALGSLGVPQPRRLILVSPWLDVSVEDPEVEALAEVDPILALPGLREAARMYAGGLNFDDPRVSPLRGSFKGLAPISVFTGTHDIAHANAKQLKERLTTAGIPLDFKQYDDMVHSWILLKLPESKAALREIAHLIKG